MLSEILQLIQGETQSQVSNNPEIANENSGDIAQMAHETVTNNLQDSLSGGGLTSILGVLSGKGGADGSQPLIQNMITQFAGKLSSSNKATPSAANGIAATLIPAILSQIANKSNDPSDKSMDINSIIGGLMGHQTQVGEQVSVPGQGNIDFAQILSVVSGNGGQAASTDTQGAGFDISQLSSLFGGK